MFATVAKVYNQSEQMGQKLLDGIKSGQLGSQNDIDTRIGGLVKRDPQHPDEPTYMESGRDAALKGAELFNMLRNADAKHPLHAPWQAVTGQGLLDPGALGNDPKQPDLRRQYDTVKAAFVQPGEGKAFVDALGKSGSYHYGDPKSTNSRGFYAQGRDFVQWDRDGPGRAFIASQWSDVQRSDLSLERHKDRSQDLNIQRNGHAAPLLHVAAPAGRTHAVLEPQSQIEFQAARVAATPAAANDPFEQLYQAAVAGDDKAFSAVAEAYGRSAEGQALFQAAHAANQQQDLQQVQQLAAAQQTNAPLVLTR